ncbi:hypothetical protein ACO2Q2_14820 [Dyella sp. KRB-257]|uniref:hypothetical protein n=1 Tax=Dyella sp. KRB-257 TaxID=3400915 RepID=UPI003C08808B
MKIRSVSAVFVLTVIASGAMAGETVRVAAQDSIPLPAHPVHPALAMSTQALTDLDVVRLTRAAMTMPACSTCH